MAGVNVGSVFFDVGFNSSAFRSGVNNDAKFAENTFGKAFAKIGKMAAGIFTAGAIIKFGKDSMNAYQAVAQEQTRLAQVMRNTMGATNGQIQAVLDLTGAYQQLGIVDDDVQQAGLQELSTYLSKTSSIKTLLPVMNDMIAQQYGYEASAQSAVNIATMMGKVMDGQTGALSRYGYSFTSAQEKILKFGNEEQRAAVLADVVTQSIGGMNAAMAKTPTGVVAQLKNNFSGLKETIGQGVNMAFASMAGWLNGIIALLSKAFSWLNALISRLTGFSMALPSAGAGGGISSVGDAAEESAGQAGKAAKKIKRSLAPFDELNNLLTPEDTSGGGAGAGVGAGAGFDIGELEETESVFDAIFASVDAWLAKMKKLLQPTIDAFKGLWVQLKRVGQFSWENLKNFYEDFLKPVGKWVLGKGLPRFINLVSDTLAKINFAKINSALRALYKALAPFAIQIGEGLIDFYEKFLKPIITWVMNEAIPTFLEWMASAIEWLTPLVRNIVPVLLVFATTFAVVWGVIKFGTTIVQGLSAAFSFLTSPIGLVVLAIAALAALAYVIITNWEPIKEWFIGIWESIKDAWNACATWFNDNVIIPVSTFFTSLWEGISTAAATAWTAIETAWLSVSTWFNDNIITPVAEFFSGLWTGISEGASTAWTGLTTGDWSGFKEWASPLTDAVSGFFGTMWSGISSAADTAWESIKTTWLAVKTWFDTNLITPLKTAFDTAWTSIKGFFSNAWQNIKSVWTTVSNWFDTNVIKPIKNLFDGMATAIKSVINGIIGAANWVITQIESGINSIISGINHAVSWLGIGTITEVSFPRIPELATGGIVSQPTLAMVGEAGREAVLPLESNTGWMVTLANIIAQALAAVLASQNTSGDTRDHKMVMEMDGKTMGEALLPYILAAAERQGYKLT